MHNACSSKCITSYKDGDLSPGEETCMERCAQKYNTTVKKVSEQLTKNRQMGGAVPPS